MTKQRPEREIVTAFEIALSLYFPSHPLSYYCGLGVYRKSNFYRLKTGHAAAHAVTILLVRTVLLAMRCTTEITSLTIRAAITRHALSHTLGVHGTH